MPYLVMARKWRPQTFDSVIGQEHITATLKNAIQTGRIHHAYLFTGTRGVGKTTSARILAKALNCVNGPTFQPCGQCDNCKQIAGGHHIDVLEIDGASNRGIDEIRDLRERVRYTPSQARYKVYIIDEVHMLTNEAFNALLKTLEEPPSHVIFIFATTEVHKIPATIISRCQKYDFRRISPKEIQDRLEEIVQAEQMKIEPEALYLVAKKADGSLRDAESLLDQIVSFSSEKVTAKDVQRILGVVDLEIYFKIIDCILMRDLPSGMNIVDSIFAQGYDLHEFALGLIEHFRNLLIFKTIESNTALINVPDSSVMLFKAAAQKFATTDILRLLNIALKVEADTRKNVHSRSQLELSIITMIHLESSLSLDAVLTYLKKGAPITPVITAPAMQILTTPVEAPAEIAPKKSTLIEPAQALPPVQPVVQPASEASPLSRAEANSDIKALLKQRLSRLVGMYLDNSTIVAPEENVIEIQFPIHDSFNYSQAKDAQNLKLIEDAARNIYGTNTRIYCTLEKSSPSAPPHSESASLPIQERPAPRPQKLADTVLQETPGLKLVLELFNGEVVV